MTVIGTTQVAKQMTLFLASVRDEAEAAIALLAGADIIDLKEPRRGALGALDRETTRSIVSLIGGRVPVSATIGDLPMHPETIGDAVLEKAACGVDYVKFGLFPDGDARRCLDALRPLARRVHSYPRAVRRRFAGLRRRGRRGGHGSRRNHARHRG